MLYNFYIDKRKNNKNDKFVDIKMDYPIEVGYNEYLKVKLIDFKYFNNLYNINSVLQNNQFIIRKTPTTYITLDESYHSIDLSTEFYTGDILNNTLNGNTIRTYENANIDEVIQTTNYKVIYTRPTGTGAVPLFKNIFTGVDNNGISMDQRYNEIIVENKLNPFLLKRLSWGVYDDGSIIPEAISFKLEISGSVDGISYVNIPFITNDTISYPIRGILVSPTTTSSLLKVLTNITPYRFYKFKVVNLEHLETSTYYNNIIGNFKLSRLQLQDVEYNNDIIVGTPINYNITIPNGFYNSTNFITTINTLLIPHELVLSLNTITNKISIANNTTFLPLLETTDISIELLLPNLNIKENFGIEEDIIDIFRTGYTADNNINLINTSKIILATNLNFTNNTHNELIDGNSEATGIANILAWIDLDDPPMSCIKYRNYENNEYKIENKIITNIEITFYNEKLQQLVLDNALIHLQVKKVRSKYY